MYKCYETQFFPFYCLFVIKFNIRFSLIKRERGTNTYHCNNIYRKHRGLNTLLDSYGVLSLHVGDDK